MRVVVRRVLPIGVILAVALALVGAIALHGASGSVQAASSGGGGGQSLCIAHHPNEYYSYAAGCTGHDEPEIDPLSNHPGSAKDLTWTVVLPTDASTAVDAVGPTFWIGGTVSDPESLFGQSFLELQFYPNSHLSTCSSNGGFSVSHAQGEYTVCSPVWRIDLNGKTEHAAFNAMLTDSASGGPLVMHAGDTITDHQYVTPAADGMHITVTDLTTGHSGTIVLNGQDGPLMPAYDTQQLGNALAWGIVDDAPNSLVWEIGHTSPYTSPGGQFCLPGSATKPPCYSYDVPTWLGFQPLKIVGVTFGDGSKAQGWASVSDFGGKAEINQDCGAANYGAPFCTYPWFTLNKAGYYTFGGDYPNTFRDFGQADQFQQTTQCPSPSGPNTTYCATVLK
jgi:hypothetical protein